MAKKLKVAVVIGARSDEYVSCCTLGAYIFKTLDRKKYTVSSIRVTKDGFKWLFPKNKNRVLPQDLSEVSKNAYSIHSIGEALDRIKKEKIDVVFLATPGGYGEDGTFQGLFQAAGIKYTGSGVLASALAMDKLRAQYIYSIHGLPVPKTIAFTRKEWSKNRKKIEADTIKKIGIPCFIKPTANGSSIGAGPVKVKNALQSQLKKAFEHSTDVLVQELIDGKELTCAVVDNGVKEPFALTPTEIVPKGGEFYSYEHKHVMENGLDEHNPARVPAKIIKKIQEYAVQAHKALGCSGVSRTDMMLTKKGRLILLETNTIPGMTAASVYSFVVPRFGMSIEDFLDTIVSAGLHRETY